MHYCKEKYMIKDTKQSVGSEQSTWMDKDIAR
jgi:hypothetical protein